MYLIKPDGSRQAVEPFVKEVPRQQVRENFEMKKPNWWVKLKTWQKILVIVAIIVAIVILVLGVLKLTKSMKKEKSQRSNFKFRFY